MRVLGTRSVRAGRVRWVRGRSVRCVQAAGIGGLTYRGTYSWSTALYAAATTPDLGSSIARMVQAPQSAGSTSDFRFVGRRTRRADAPERLTGRLRFTNDLLMPGALHVRFVRSPHASARIVSIDTSAALAIPGVVAVLTARDLPVADIHAAVEARRIMLALDDVLYAGHPVVAVLAESEALAEDGVQAVEVDYEPLPAAVDVLDAMAPDAPVVRQRREQDESELAIHGAATGGQAVDSASGAERIQSRAVPARRRRGWASARPTWSSSGSSAPPGSIRGTWSRRAVRPGRTHSAI